MNDIDFSLTVGELDKHVWTNAKAAARGKLRATAAIGSIFCSREPAT
jgi:hypothetical protein